MIFYPEERIAIFIDGANLYSAARGLAFDIDYKRLLELFRTKGRLVRAFYYTALVEEVQHRGVRVSVVSTIKSSPPMVSDDLRRQADAFIELQDLAPSISRNHHARDEAHRQRA